MQAASYSPHPTDTSHSTLTKNNPNIQKEMKEVKLKEGEVAIKSLHKQVNALGKARTELQHANAARLALHSSWRAFLVEQVSKWQAYSQQFQQQESALAERVSAARTALDKNKGVLYYDH